METAEIILNQEGNAFAFPSLSSRSDEPDFVPKLYTQAVNCVNRKKWIEAINREFQAHKLNNTWTVIKHPGKANIINSMWPFNEKIDCAGNKVAKARLVACGSRDRNTYTNRDTYASVCPIKLVRLVLSIGIHNDMRIVSFNISTAFLYGNITDRDVFVRIPQGLNIDPKTHVLKLNKSMYGLKISSKIWQDKFHEVVINFGFIQSTAERCIYYFRDSHNLAILVSYVDDVLLTSNSNFLIGNIRKYFESSFKLKYTDNPKIFLSLQMNVKDNEIIINQLTYIESMAKNFNLTEGQKYLTPMEHALKVTRSNIPNDDLTYRQRIGALLFLARFSRPDIAYAVNFLSSFQGHITKELSSYVNRIIRYVYDTRFLSLKFNNVRSENSIIVWVDASHAPDTDSKLISGSIIFHHLNPFDWHVSKQTPVAKSSTAAEIHAVADMLDYVLIPRHLLFKIFQEPEPALIFEDNESAT
jgi:hypothetical protein